VEQTKPKAQLPFKYRKLGVPLMTTVFNTMAIWMMMVIIIIMPLLKKKRNNLI
jgi:short subunit fatty acids transporter